MMRENPGRKKRDPRQKEGDRGPIGGNPGVRDAISLGRSNSTGHARIYRALPSLHFEAGERAQHYKCKFGGVRPPSLGQRLASSLGLRLAPLSSNPDEAQTYKKTYKTFDIDIDTIPTRSGHKHNKEFPSAPGSIGTGAIPTMLTIDSGSFGVGGVENGVGRECGTGW